MQKLIKHNNIAKWQEVQMSIAMDSLPKGMIIFHVDFVENYGFQPFNEIKMEYCHSFQIRIWCKLWEPE